MNDATSTTHEKPDFSLVVGGPLYQLLLRSGLAQEPLHLVHRRILAIILLTWAPLAVLSALDGAFLGGVAVPFLFDLADLRFVIVLPILIGAEVIVHQRMRSVVAEFLTRGLVAPEDRARFDAIIRQATLLRNSITVEVIILLLSFTGGYWLWRSFVDLKHATWYALPQGESLSFTWAGWWLTLVSLPAFRFITMRWYFRLLIWYIFLWRVSRLRLRLNPLHPDRAGGLGFLQESVTAFGPVLIAQSVFLSAMIGEQILHYGAHLPDFKFEILGFAVFLMLVVLVPLVFFILQMVQAKLTGLRAYGQLATSSAEDFRQKWLQGKEPTEHLLGANDIQSLADLANVYDLICTMRLVPISKGLLLQLAIMIVVPLLPLVLTLVPFEELMERLMKLLV